MRSRKESAMTTEPVVNRNVYRDIHILDIVRYRLPPVGMVSTHSVSKEKGRTSALLTLATGALVAAGRRIDFRQVVRHFFRPVNESVWLAGWAVQALWRL